MAKSKRLNASDFGNIVKEFTAYSELIKTRQGQKQAAMDSFDREVKASRAGKISKKALRSSVPRVNKVIRRLDKEIGKHIASIKSTSRRAVNFASRQRPKKVKATMQGIRSAGSGKKKAKKTRKKGK